MASTRGRKFACCGVVTLIILAIIFIVLLTLSLTIFKPKNPGVSVRPASLKNFDISFRPDGTMNVTLGLIITIDNRNYESFKYEYTRGTVDYRGIAIGGFPLEQYLVPARAKVDIHTSADLTMGHEVIINPFFWSDVGKGSLNMTSSTTLHGKVNVLNAFKLHATTFITCDISAFIRSRDIVFICESKIKM